MRRKIALTSIHYRNFKALGDFHVSLQDMNIFVGPNNSGKSTLLGALRVLAAGLQKARIRNPDYIDHLTAQTGYWIPEDSIPISLENVRTNYNDSPTSIDFRLSNANRLELRFFGDRSCALIPNAQGRRVRDTVTFKSIFPLTVAAVPVLGPVEHEEGLLDPGYVRRGLSTHRASRHFRNYWKHNPDLFDDFASKVRLTWPGMEIQPPELVVGEGQEPRLAMFCSEDRVARELYWAGSGFQVWCQILTHIVRSKDASILVVDEPEIYLHPELQRQLLSILRESGPQIVLATHSSEIVGEADPQEVLVVDKTAASARRMSRSEGAGKAMQALGSRYDLFQAQQIVRTRRVLFVEGVDDYRTLGWFAEKLGLLRLAARADFAVVSCDGFPDPSKIAGMCRAIQQLAGAPVAFAGVFDRDFRCDEEIEAIGSTLRKLLDTVHIFAAKELENYLLMSAVLDRAIIAAIEEKWGDDERRQPLRSANEILSGIIEKWHDHTKARFVVNHTRYLRASGLDEVSLQEESTRIFSERWEFEEARLWMVPGKSVLSEFNTALQADLGVSLSDRLIVDSFRLPEIPTELKRVVESLDRFRIGGGTPDSREATL